MVAWCHHSETLVWYHNYEVMAGGCRCRFMTLAHAQFTVSRLQQGTNENGWSASSYPCVYVCVCICVFLCVSVCVRSSCYDKLMCWRKGGCKWPRRTIHTRERHTGKPCVWVSMSSRFRRLWFIFRWHILFKRTQNYSPDEYRCELSQFEWATAESVSKFKLYGLNNHRSLLHTATIVS